MQHIHLLTRVTTTVIIILFGFREITKGYSGQNPETATVTRLLPVEKVLSLLAQLSLINTILLIFMHLHI